MQKNHFKFVTCLYSFPVETLLDLVLYFIDSNKISAIICHQDHLLIPEQLFMEILHILLSIGIKSKTRKYWVGIVDTPSIENWYH